MANHEHLDILKQGVDVWNKWRQKHLEIRPDFSEAHLSGAELSFAHRYSADLSGANLIEANLIKADLSNANLSKADLSNAYLSLADLSRATLTGAMISGVNLSGVNLSGVNLSGADLIEADLSGAILSDATVGWTTFAGIDLSLVKGLETVIHLGHSSIGIDTIYRSQGNIPDNFLRGAGIEDTFINYIHSLVSHPIEYYTCFISYSSKDQAFAERLYADLQNKGVHCWFAPHDMRIGDEIRPRIDESIRIHDKLLLILSESSVKSQWVKKEVETAFEKERRRKKLVLYPIKLDETVTRTRQAWAADIRRQRLVGDFTCWKDHDAYQKAFDRLLRDLKAKAQKMGSRDATTNGG